jgi:hypothetical protein
MPSPVNYYIYNKIIKSPDKKINDKILKDAVSKFGFKQVYSSGYISHVKKFKCINRKILEESKLLSQRTINYIYE